MPQQAHGLFYETYLWRVRSRTIWDALVIGGGFFGCRVAQHLASFLEKVIVVEEAEDLLQRASYANQARVHQGYHYPRSLLTAIRSRINFTRFVEEYPDCVDVSFANYYAISRLFSNVTARQFREFCVRIGAPIEPAPVEVRRLFDRDRIEDVFRVEEWAFDAVKLKERVRRDLREVGVLVRLGTRAVRVSGEAGGGLAVDVAPASATSRDGLKGHELEPPRTPPERLFARTVLNCTYSGINRLLTASDLPLVPLKHEAAEIALVDPPPPLAKAGITVMCGPFFSIMPFAAAGLHSLSHVRFTPHHQWHEGDAVRERPDPRGTPLRSAFDRMVRDAARFVPCVSECRYRGSLWEVKTVLPKSEQDDSRPILFRANHGLLGLTCLMGGKIDNVYDVLQELDELRRSGGLS